MDDIQTGSTNPLKINESSSKINDTDYNFWLKSKSRIIKNLLGKSLITWIKNKNDKALLNSYWIFLDYVIYC
jgi:hypothetical protein